MRYAITLGVEVQDTIVNCFCFSWYNVYFLTHFKSFDDTYQTIDCDLRFKQKHLLKKGKLFTNGTNCLVCFRVVSFFLPFLI